MQNPQQEHYDEIHENHATRNHGASALAYRSGLTALALLLALVIAAAPPQFGKDAQFYVQEGPLWAAGNVTFGGSLVGDRHLAVLAYYLPRLALWDSIDALSITLGTIFFCFALALMSLAGRVAGYNGISFVGAAGSMVIASLAPVWTSPATDNLFLLVVMVGSLLYVLLVRSSDAVQASKWIVVLGLWCGFCTGIRSEALLLFLACAVTLAAPVPAWPRFRQRAAGILLGGACFVLSSVAQSALFPLWTGVAKPAQLSGFLLFYETAEKWLDPTAGPASARLHAMLDSAEREMAAKGMTGLLNPRFRVAGIMYEEGRGQAASELFRRAGIESLLTHPGKVVDATLASIWLYLTAPEGVLTLDRRSHDARRADTWRTLFAMDEIRIRTSPFLGHDAHWRVATLAQGPPVHRFDWPHPTGYPPAWGFTAMLVLGAGGVLARRRWNGILPMTLCLVGMLMVLTAFSQGYALRYWLSWSVVLSVAVVIELTGEVARRRHHGTMAVSTRILRRTIPMSSPASPSQALRPDRERL